MVKPRELRWSFSSMVPVMPDNPALGNDSPYAGDGRFRRLSFNDGFMTSQPVTPSYVKHYSCRVGMENRRA